MINGKHLLAPWGEEKERKKDVGGEKEKKKKFVCLQPPRLELSPFTLPQLYQRTELT